MGDRQAVSDVNKEILYIDANNPNGWAMNQYLPIGEFEKLQLCWPSVSFGTNNYTDDYNLEQLVEDLLQIPDDNEYEFFTECDLEYPVETEQTTETFLYQVEADCELFSDYIDFIEQPHYKTTQKLVCDLTNKQKFVIHHSMFKFFLSRGMKVTKLHNNYPSSKVHG